ncbi:hypothetical protein FSP39_022794, partial [Pinctada imbricata]
DPAFLDQMLDRSQSRKDYHPYQSPGCVQVGDQVHRLVSLEEKKQRTCQFCKAMGVKRGSGSSVVTRHKCDICNIAICVGKKKRSCFLMYHQQLQAALESSSK